MFIGFIKIHLHSRSQLHFQQLLFKLLSTQQHQLWQLFFSSIKKSKNTIYIILHCGNFAIWAVFVKYTLCEWWSKVQRFNLPYWNTLERHGPIHDIKNKENGCQRWQRILKVLDTMQNFLCPFRLNIQLTKFL